MGIRSVFSMDSLKDGLQEALPEGAGKDTAVDDIYLLSDMLTCLINCNDVGLRIEPLSRTICPKLHTDNIPLRLVNTYLGAGTQWLPRESIGKPSATQSLDKYPYGEEAIQQMNRFDVGLLKGSAWEKYEHMAAEHRSCQLQENQKRVLLTLDPM